MWSAAYGDNLWYAAKLLLCIALFAMYIRCFQVYLVFKYFGPKVYMMRRMVGGFRNGCTYYWNTYKQTYCSVEGFGHLSLYYGLNFSQLRCHLVVGGELPEPDQNVSILLCFFPYQGVTKLPQMTFLLKRPF